MRIVETPLSGAYIIELEPIVDQRGFFARSFSMEEVCKKIDSGFAIAQQNVSFNHKRGTLRGLHFQNHPHAEIKLVRCTRGAMWDVIVDIRPNSPTFKKWHAVELTAENRKTFYIPKGFAHGFITLEDNTEVFYQVSEYFHPPYYRGLRWDEQEFNILWPFEPTLISDKDRALPGLDALLHEL